MSLLDDIREDLIADSLSKPAAPRAHPEWKPSVTWTFSGYIGRVRNVECPNCKKCQWQSDGVFAEEVGSNGTRRLAQATQWPMGASGRRLELTQVKGTHPCDSCLIAFGFDDLVKAPDTPTNISGQGFVPAAAPTPRANLGFKRPLSKDDKEFLKGA